MSYTKTPLRVSTMVITAHWGTSIQLDKLSTLLSSIMIPIWYPDTGILKFEHTNMVLGSSFKDIFTNRKITSKSFFNQSTMVIRQKIMEDCEEKDQSWKEVNVKLFANGGIQMTGVTSEPFARKTINWLLDKFINQDALHKLLINEYNLFSMLEKTIYQGVNTKFFYNTMNPGVGICQCTTTCKGQGTGNGNGQCKRITMSIFRTGKIIITGARLISQIEAAYDFLNKVYDKHHKTVLYTPNQI